MAWITSPELVAAVSNAGGLGVLGTSGGFETLVSSVEETVEEMRKVIRRTKELTDKPFGMNIFPAASDSYGFSKATIELCKEEGVMILVAAGNIAPEEYKQWKQDGFTLIVREMNPTVRGAIEAEKAGADIIVATGCDEGGCMPVLTTGTIAAVALFKDAVSIPILAAGGIVNENMAKASAAVGAEGAFAGTRFILSKECRAAENIKNDIMETHPDDYIVFTQMNGMARWRTTPHKIGFDGLEENKKGNNNPESGSFYYGMLKGGLDEGVNTVSNVACLIKQIDSCKDIVDELAKAYE